MWPIIDDRLGVFDFMWQSPTERKRKSQGSMLSRKMQAERKAKNKTSRKSRRVNKK